MDRQIKDDDMNEVHGRLEVTVESPWLFGPPYPGIDPISRIDPYPGLEYRPGTEGRVGYVSSIATAEVVVHADPVPPPRKKRIMWDVYHNIGYPSAFVPRDDLGQSK
jgi:hypothetical protein